jgi:uncharacterized membrane protein YwzB
MPALPHHSPLSVYTPYHISSKITCPPQKTLLYLNKKTYKQKTVMNPLLFILIVGWSMLISFTIPKFIKNEELKYGVTLMLNSMSLGVYLGVTIGALFF